MSSCGDSQPDALRTGVAGRRFTRAGESLIRISVPPGTPREAEVAINRLVELTAILARRASQLQKALDSRVVIEQAKGVLAERYSLSLDDAFKMLRQGARSNRVRLHELAACVVELPVTPPEIRTPSLDGH